MRSRGINHDGNLKTVSFSLAHSNAKIELPRIKFFFLSLAVEIFTLEFSFFVVRENKFFLRKFSGKSFNPNSLYVKLISIN